MPNPPKRTPVTSLTAAPADAAPLDTSVEERRQNIFKMRLRGKSQQAIADVLNISVATVQRDLEIVKKENRELFQYDRQELIMENLKGYDDVSERAWFEYENSQPGTTNRLKALDLVRVARNDRVKFLQECGFIEVAAQEKTEHKVSLDIIQHWTPELREAASRAIVESMLTKQLPPPRPLDEVLKERGIIDVPEIIQVDSEDNKK